MIRCVEHLVLATPPPTNMRSPTPMGTYQTCFARNSLPMRDGPEVTAGRPVPNHSGNHNPPTAHQGLCVPQPTPAGTPGAQSICGLPYALCPLAAAAATAVSAT